jgi:hypothetical protein
MGKKNCYIRESTLPQGDNAIASFFKVPMFELQPCHFQEEFSQCFAYYNKPKHKIIKTLSHTFFFTNMF